MYLPEECYILCCRVHSKLRVIFVAIEISIFARKKKEWWRLFIMSAQEFSQDGVKIQRSNHETITNYITITYSNQEMNGLYMKNLKEKIN